MLKGNNYLYIYVLAGLVIVVLLLWPREFEVGLPKLCHGTDTEKLLAAITLYNASSHEDEAFAVISRHIIEDSSLGLRLHTVFHVRMSPHTKTLLLDVVKGNFPPELRVASAIRLRKVAASDSQVRAAFAALSDDPSISDGLRSEVSRAASKP